MRHIFVLLFAVFANLTNSQVFAQYACSAEQLRDRYKPVVPAQAGAALWNSHGFKSSDPLNAIQQYLATKGSFGTCNCKLVSPTHYFCNVVEPSLGCIAEGGVSAAKESTFSCPPQYELASQQCRSPLLRFQDQLDEQYGHYRIRNQWGQSKVWQDEHGEQWTVEQYDDQGRPTLIRKPGGATELLTWSGTNIATHEADGGQGVSFLTRYHYSAGSGTPVAVETRGVAYAVIHWDAERIAAATVETSGGSSVLLNVGTSLPPSMPRASMGIAAAAAAAPAAPLFYVIDFPLVPGPPVIKLGIASFTAGFFVGTQVYPLIEPWITRVVDACTLSSAPEFIKDECVREAWSRLDKRGKACHDAWIRADTSDPAVRKAFLDCQERATKMHVNELLACENKPPKYPEVSE